MLTYEYVSKIKEIKSEHPNHEGEKRTVFHARSRARKTVFPIEGGFREEV
jgi:hypothetical protein